MVGSLKGKVALVAGSTRGAGRGIAVELGAAGAIVDCTGRTTDTQRSEMNRPETIEETAPLVDAAGGSGKTCGRERVSLTQAATQRWAAEALFGRHRDFKYHFSI